MTYFLSGLKWGAGIVAFMLGFYIGSMALAYVFYLIVG